MPSKKVPITKRYFAQVGDELLELPAEHVEAHQDGAAFSTSAPVLFYKVTATVGDPDKGPSVTVSGAGATWADAEQALAAKLPKENA